MQLELRRLVALNPNVQFSIRRLFSEGNFSSHRNKKICTHHLQSDLCMTPNFLPQVWARKLFPFILFYSGFKILLLRSWRCRRVQYVVQIAVCINNIFSLVFVLYFCISLKCFIFVKGLAGIFVWNVYVSYQSLDSSLFCIGKCIDM